MAVVVPEYVANDLPLHQIFKSFLIGPRGDKQITFFKRVYAEIPAFPAELKKNKVHPLLFATGYPVGFFSTKPLNTLNDLKGTWRTASFWHRDYLKNIGANPVTMPWGEGVTKALQAGTLDGLMVNVDSADDIKAQKSAPHLLASADLWMGHIYLVVINENTWNALAPEDQQAIQRAAEKSYQKLGAIMGNHFNALLDTMKKDGVTVRQLTLQELTEWQAATNYRDVQTAWAATQESKGIKNAVDVLQKVTVIIEDTMK